MIYMGYYAEVPDLQRIRIYTLPNKRQWFTLMLHESGTMPVVMDVQLVATSSTGSLSSEYWTPRAVRSSAYPVSREVGDLKASIFEAFACIRPGWLPGWLCR